MPTLTGYDDLGNPIYDNNATAAGATPTAGPAYAAKPLNLGNRSIPTPPGELPAGSSPADYLNHALQVAQGNRADSLGYIDNTLTPAADNATVAASNALQQRQQLYGASGNLVGAYGATNQGILNTLGTDFAGQNQTDLSALQNYQSVANQANASDAGYMGNLQSVYNSMGILQPKTAWAGDLTSQAAQAYADPNDIAHQNQAYGALQSAAGGGLNYSSQAAQAYANPQDIANQNYALSGLQSAMQGQLSYNSQAANAYANPDDIRDQRAGALDLQGVGRGNLDQVAEAQYARPDQNAVDAMDSGLRGLQDYARGGAPQQADQKTSLNDFRNYINGTSPTQQNQLEALAKYKSLTTPEVTDAERFIYEQARQREEQDSRSSRDAIMRDRTARGMAGSGDELAAMLQSNQGYAQNRVLTDLGAGKNAIDRQMEALAGYGNMSNAYANEGLQAIAGYGNQANVMAAQGLQAQGMAFDAAGNIRQQSFAEDFSRKSAVDAVNNANANRRLTGMEDYQVAAEHLRQMGFSEEYARGQAADIASQFNSTTKLNATNMYGNLASNMRNSGFNEAYSRGLGADAASANNQSTMLNASNMSGQLASNMRNSSFNENLQRGNAADLTAQYNRTTSLNVQNFIDNYAAGQQTAQWNRTNDLTNTGLTYGANLSNRGYQGLVGTLATTSAATGRSKDLASATSQTNNNNLAAGQWYVGQGNDVANAGQDAAAQAAGRQIAIGGLRTNASIGAASPVIDMYGKLAADAASDAAINAVKKERPIWQRVADPGGYIWPNP